MGSWSATWFEFQLRSWEVKDIPCIYTWCSRPGRWSIRSLPCSWGPGSGSLAPPSPPSPPSLPSLPSPPSPPMATPPPKMPARCRGPGPDTAGSSRLPPAPGGCSSWSADTPWASSQFHRATPNQTPSLHLFLFSHSISINELHSNSVIQWFNDISFELIIFIHWFENPSDSLFNFIDFLTLISLFLKIIMIHYQIQSIWWNIDLF